MCRLYMVPCTSNPRGTDALGATWFKLVAEFLSVILEFSQELLILRVLLQVEYHSFQSTACAVSKVKACQTQCPLSIWNV